MPPSSARLYMALLTDNQHPRSNQSTVAVIQSPLQPGLMTLISPNLVWCVFPQRTPSLLVRTPVSLRLTQPLPRLYSSSIDHPKSRAKRAPLLGCLWSNGYRLAVHRKTRYEGKGSTQRERS